MSKGIRLVVMRDTPLEKKQTIQNELRDLSSSQLTVVRIQNMFTPENVIDRSGSSEAS